MLQHIGSMLIKNKFRVYVDFQRLVQKGNGHHLQRTGFDPQTLQKLRDGFLPGDRGSWLALMGDSDGLTGGEHEVAAGTAGDQLSRAVSKEHLSVQLVHVDIGVVADNVEGKSVHITGVWGHRQGEDGESRYCCDSDQPFHLRSGFPASFKHDT